MYDSGMQESRTSEINMCEFDAWIVLELLRFGDYGIFWWVKNHFCRYLYVGDVQNLNDLNSAEQLFYAADMFMIEELKVVQ